MNNVVPLPYSRVAVQIADFALGDASIRNFLRGKEVWFETDHVVFRHSDQCAIAHIEKTAPKEFFCRIIGVEMVSLPSATRWVDDPSVDAGNPSALAEKAHALGIDPSETLVVNGLYEHVCFIHHPNPVMIDVFDLSPPEPPRLLDMARRVLAYKTLPPTIIRPHVQLIPDLVRDVSDKSILFPCGISQLKRMTNAFYLDELSMSMNMPKALPTKLWFPSIDHVTNEPVGVPARVSAQVAVDAIGLTNSSLRST